jgi:hypothetical protein
VDEIFEPYPLSSKYLPKEIAATEIDSMNISFSVTT